MDELTSAQMMWLVGSAIVGIVMLLVVPIASVGNEVTYLGSLEAEGRTAPPIKKRFDVVYWPLHVFIVLSWALVIALKCHEEPDIKAAMWKMMGIYCVLVFFSYFMHVAGKNYVVQHTDGIQMDKNLQMTAILATFTIVIYIAGSVAAIITLTTGRLNPDEESFMRRMSNKLRKNNEIERWPSKIDRISALYEKLIEPSKHSPTERAKKRKALVASLKNVHTFKEAYQILQAKVNALDVSMENRQEFLVQSADIIAESEDPPAPSIFRKIIDVVKPGALASAITPVAPASAINHDVPEFIDLLTYTGSYFELFIEDTTRANTQMDIVFPKNEITDIANYTLNTTRRLNKGETKAIDVIKN